LTFDPKGADFAAWVNHFKDQVYKHWPPPSDKAAGARGHAVLEFTLTRDGSLKRVRVKESTGDRAVRALAESALRASQFLPLPAMYTEKAITMRATFRLNEKPAAAPRHD
jgi:TonB family protein